MKKIIFMLSLFVLSICSVAIPQSTESTTVAILDSLGEQILVKTTTPETYNKIIDNINNSFTENVKFVETKNDTSFFIKAGKYISDASTTLYERTKMTFKQIGYDIAHADKFWAGVNNVVLWLKGIATNVYHAYKLQYQLIGAATLLKLLLCISGFIFLIWFYIKKIYTDKLLQVKNEPGLYFFVNLFSIFIISSIGIAILIADWTNVFMLINPDYYIIKEILSIWK
jgi:hypothetical protein